MTRRFGKWLTTLGAVQEALVTWALAFLSLVIAFVLWRDVAKIVATLGFIYLPLLAMDARGEDYAAYGLTLRKWKEDLTLFVVLAALITPLYILGFFAFSWLLSELPSSVASHLSPRMGTMHDFRFRLPQNFLEWSVDQVFVVALPEEFFYRGFIQTRLRDAWPEGRKVLGARLGRAFWFTQLLFALGHLAIFQFWRLGVFFPALLFGWMKERTGSLLGPALFHAYCNLLALVLQRSFFH